MDSGLVRKENAVCVDCQEEASEYVQLEVATFICKTCAREHRKLVSNNEVIKALECRTWSEAEIKRLGAGGNALFLQFLALYPFERESIVLLYRTKAVNFYKQMLNAIVDGRLFPYEPPSPEEGTKLIQNFYSDPIKPTFFSKTIDRTWCAGMVLTRKLKSIATMPQVQSFEEKAAEIYASMQTKAKKMNEESVQPRLSQAKLHTLRAFGFLKDQARAVTNTVWKSPESELNTFEDAELDPESPEEGENCGSSKSDH